MGPFTKLKTLSYCFHPCINLNIVFCEMANSKFSVYIAVELNVHFASSNCESDCNCFNITNCGNLLSKSL